jgi:hypothetical protein
MFTINIKIIICRGLVKMLYLVSMLNFKTSWLFAALQLMNGTSENSQKSCE